MGRRRTHNRVAALVGAALLVVAGTVLAVDRGGDSTNVATGPAGQETVPAGGSLRDSAFCRQAPKPGAEMPESYVGSPQHLAALARVAPPAVGEDLLRFRAYVQASVAPARPDSQLTENWPPDIRSAVERVQRFIRGNCGWQHRGVVP